MENWQLVSKTRKGEFWEIHEPGELMVKKDSFKTIEKTGR